MSYPVGSASGQPLGHSAHLPLLRSGSAIVGPTAFKSTKWLQIKWTPLDQADEFKSSGLRPATHQRNDFRSKGWIGANDFKSVGATASLLVFLALGLACERLALPAPFFEDVGMLTYVVSPQLIASVNVEHGAYLEKRAAGFPDRVSDGLREVMPWLMEPEFE
jgi:hypothetical protein